MMRRVFVIGLVWRVRLLPGFGDGAGDEAVERGPLRGDGEGFD